MQIPASSDAIWCQRSFDRERLAWELKFFRQKYLRAVIDMKLSRGEEEQFVKDCDALADALGNTAHYFVHRDFHSRNIMVYKEQYAVIDFQDARLGNPCYDLVSLIYDSYVQMSAEERQQITTTTLKEFVAEELMTADEMTTWPAVLLQRQLKAIGSFGYLTVEKDRGDYLKYVNPALLTLSHELVYDARWPFLSGALLEKMKKAQGLV